MLVQDGLGDAGRLRDLVHRRRVEAVLAEDLQRDVEQLLRRRPAGRRADGGRAGHRPKRTPPQCVVGDEAPGHLALLHGGERLVDAVDADLAAR